MVSNTISGNRGTRENPVEISDDESFDYALLGTREHPIPIYSDDTSGRWYTSGYYDSSSDSYLNGATDFSNWTIPNPSEVNSPRKSEKGKGPSRSQESTAGPSRPRKPRMTVKGPTETFTYSMPTSEELRETWRNLNEQDDEDYNPSPYTMSWAPAYVLEANPNVIEDITDATWHPPPQLGYPHLYPQTVTEHLDRTIQGNRSLHEVIENDRRERQRRGQQMVQMGNNVISLGAEILKVGEDMIN